MTFKSGAGAMVGAMVTDKVCVGEMLPALSFTLTAKLNGLPVVVVGVPEITPEGLSVKPGGKDPIAVQLPYGGLPPPAISVVE